MRSLEEITRDLFTRYSERKTGRRAAWHKLNAERQADWLEDSYMLMDELLTQLEKELDLKVTDKKPNTSFESGILQGMSREQTKINKKLKDLREKYLQELSKFIKQWND